MVLVAFMAITFNGSMSSAKEVHAVKINKKNFPDKNFREEVSLQYDDNNNGVLSKEELVEISRMVLNNYADETLPIDLEGIDFFPNIEEISVVDYSIKPKELKKYPFTTAKKIELYDAQIKNLDFSKCRNVETLCVDRDEKLRTIHFKDNYKLKYFEL